MPRAQVPKFGNWESEEIPYTTYFDNARKEKKSGQIYQTDPQDNIDVDCKDQKASEPKTPKHEQHSRPENDPSHKMHYNAQSGSDKPEALIKPRHNRRPTREEGEMKKLTDSPLRQETASRRNSSNSPHHRFGGSSAGDTPRMIGRQSVGSDRSVDHSPMHVRVGGRNSGISSPSWERKATPEGIHGLAPSTPGRSRLRSVTRGDDSPDRSPAVPKFGEWDESDPASAEGYTQIFNRVREEKHSETGKVPVMPTETSLPNGHKQFGNDDPKGCGCFGWGKR